MRVREPLSERRSQALDPGKRLRGGRSPRASQDGALVHLPPGGPPLVAAPAVRVSTGDRDYVVVGVSHHTAHVAVRERFAVDASRLPAVLDAIRARGGVDEAVLVSTCNRVEWYLAGARPAAAAAAATAFFGGPSDRRGARRGRRRTRCAMPSAWQAGSIR